MASLVLDVVVVGGGITGAGAALDAASRGLSVGLLEMSDWAAGTSSRSSKLIHGGLRYLEQMEFHLVREALTERTLLMGRIAPHLVRPVPFLYPLRHRLWERAYVGAGIGLYDTMSHAWTRGFPPGVPRHRHLGRAQATRLAPDLRRQGLRGAICYYDAQVDDARFTLAVVRTAASLGVKVASRAAMVGFLRSQGRVEGVLVRDLETGEELEIRARQVIVSAGVWTPELQALLGRDDHNGQMGPRLNLRVSKGVHLVIPRDRISLTTALISRTEKSVLLVIPWGDFWLIGTTDTDWAVNSNEPVVTSSDVSYLLDRLDSELSAGVDETDVIATYAGLRPLISAAGASSAQVSREHAILRAAPGMVVVAGGKFTTYRVMAQEAVDLATAELDGSICPSQTDQLRLLGALDDEESAALCASLATRSERLGPGAIRHLVSRYGAMAGQLVDLIVGEPALASPLSGGGQYLLAEARYAATDEGALHLEDILERRTRLALLSKDRSVGAAEAVAAVVGTVLGWDEATRASEVARYRTKVAAQARAQMLADDASASAEMLSWEQAEQQLSR